MSAPKWRRVDRASGPANVLNSRFLVERSFAPFGQRAGWVVRDLDARLRCIPGPGTTAPYVARTMAAAKTYAEQYAQTGDTR